MNLSSKGDTGTPLLTRFFGPRKNSVKGKLRYRRSILVLKPQNGEFESSKSLFEQSALHAKFIKVVNEVNDMLKFGLILYHYDLLIKLKVYHIIVHLKKNNILKKPCQLEF